MIRDWKKEYEWKELQLEKAEELLEKYKNGLNMQMKTIKFVKKHPDAELPIRAYPMDAGMDVKAVSRVFLDKFNNELDENDPESLKTACKVKYGLGFGIECPEGWAVKPYPKSSIYKKGLILSNGVGVGDTGYQGEYCAIFYLFDFSIPYEVGDSVCQLLIERVALPIPYWGEFEGKTERGNGGLGSTGNLFKK